MPDEPPIREVTDPAELAGIREALIRDRRQAMLIALFSASMFPICAYTIALAVIKDLVPCLILGGFAAGWFLAGRWKAK